MDHPSPPGVVQHLEPGLRMVLAPNPSPMTHWGTNTYLLGAGEVTVIDPGPADDRTCRPSGGARAGGTDHANPCDPCPSGPFAPRPPAGQRDRGRDPRLWRGHLGPLAPHGGPCRAWRGGRARPYLSARPPSPGRRPDPRRRLGADHPAYARASRGASVLCLGRNAVLRRSRDGVGSIPCVAD